METSNIKTSPHNGGQWNYNMTQQWVLHYSGFTTGHFTVGQSHPAMSGCSAIFTGRTPNIFWHCRRKQGEVSQTWHTASNNDDLGRVSYHHMKLGGEHNLQRSVKWLKSSTPDWSTSHHTKDMPTIHTRVEVAFEVPIEGLKWLLTTLYLVTQGPSQSFTIATPSFFIESMSIPLPGKSFAWVVGTCTVVLMCNSIRI